MTLLTHSIYLDGEGESKWVWQGCHVCSHKGQQGPVQRQEVSYPYISLCFCHQLDSPSLSFSVTLYLSPIHFCPLCLASLPVLHSHCHTSQLLSSLPLQISVNLSTPPQNTCSKSCEGKRNFQSHRLCFQVILLNKMQTELSKYLININCNGKYTYIILPLLFFRKQQGS